MEKHQLKPTTLAPDCLAGQIILITGAGGGIGRALALAAAQHGATCILLGKTLKKLEAVYDEITAQGWPEPAIHPLNLIHAQPKHATELAQSIEQMFGRLDALVHNAGISGNITPLEYLPPEKWQAVIQLNLNAPFLLTHACLGVLQKSVSPSILFTTADEGLKGKAYWAAYCASKFGLRGLAESLHEELEANTAIRVNCINPGKVRTTFRTLNYPGVEPASLTPPEEIMPYYLQLLCPQQDLRGKWVEVA